MGKLSLLLAALIAAGAMVGISPAWSADQPVGGLHGRFSVDPNGKANYVFPLPVPPGINGQHPRLQLKYSSTQANSSLGIGWSIDGLSRITRCSPNRSVDGFLAPIGFGASDRFCLDGQRLIMIKGSTYGADQSEYRTEIESWRRIVAHGTHPTSGAGCSGGPCWFSVTDRFGHAAIYGTGSAGIAAGQGPAVRVWNIASTTDLNGNQVTYSYTQDPLESGSTTGAYYIAEIDYTANAAAGVVANRKVQFTYEPRSDTVVKYQGGASIQQTARLSRVTTEVQATVAQDYRLTYHAATPSRLASIQACASTGADAACLPPTMVQWSSAITGFAAPVTALNDEFGVKDNWSSHGTRLVADVNGDGLSDIVAFGTRVVSGVATAGAWVALSQGTSFAAPGNWSSAFSGTSWSPEQTPRLVADVNGDGRADVVGFGSDGVLVGLSDGTQFASQTVFPHFGARDWNAADDPRVATDVNGDGCADIVGFQSGIHVALADCAGSFGQPQLWTSSTAFSAPNWSGSTPRLVVDLNGDGMSDVIGFGLNGVEVLLSTGTSPFVRPSWAAAWPQNAFPHFGSNDWSADDLRTVADVNGDGLPDIVGIRANAPGIQVSLNTGAGFLAPVDWCAAPAPVTCPFQADTPIQVADVNGDGMADIVNFGLNGVVVALSDGAQFVVAGSFAIDDFGSAQNWSSDTPRLVGDINGDGVTDLLGFGLSSVKLAVAALGTFPNMVDTIVDGFGGTTQISYQPMSTGVYSDPPSSTQFSNGLANASIAQPSSYPVAGVALHAGMPLILRGGVHQLVSSYTVSDGPLGNPGTSSYQSTLSYASAQLDVGGRGWQGFAAKTHVDQASGAITVTQFNQNFPLTGQPISVTLQCTQNTTLDPLCTTTGTPLHAESYAYHQTVTATGSQAQVNVYATPRKSARTDHYDYGTYRFSIGSTSAYDDWGNLALHSYLGYVAQDGTDQSPDDNVYTLRQFLPPPSGGWTLAYLQYEKVSTSASATGIDSFDPASDISLTALAYHAATMNLKTRSQWDDTNTTFLSHGYLYDGFGNPTSITDPAGNTTTVTFETAYNTYKSTKTSPPNAAGSTLTTSYGHDPRSGKLAASVGPNGDAHILCYDGFGRLTARQVPLPATQSGVTASANCVTTLLTGALPAASAAVVTAETRTHHQAEAGGFCRRTGHVAAWPTGSAPPPLSETTECFDGLGRHRRLAIPMNGGGDVSVIHRTYDSHNRLITSELPHFATDTSPVSTVLTYDAYGRVSQQQVPSGPKGERMVTRSLVHQVTATGMTTTITDASGSTAPYTRLLHDRVIHGKRLPYEMVVPGDDNARTRFGHDRLGRRTHAIDPKGVESRVQRDSLGRVAWISNPATGRIAFKHDTTGVLHSKTDALGATIYAYDALGRMLSKTLPDGSAAIFAYDLPPPDAANALGRMAAATVSNAAGTPVASRQFSYDPLGNKASETLVIASAAFGSGTGSLSFTTGYLHAPDGQLAQTTFPDGTVLVLTPSASGELSTLAIAGTTYATYEDYAPGGQPRSTSLGNGLVERRSYWPSGQQGGFAIATSTSTMLLDETYGWDDFGQLAEIVDQLKLNGVDASQTFGYTSMRLTSASAPGSYGTVGYQYDTGGNLKDLDPGPVGSKLGLAYYPNGPSNSAQQLESATDASGKTVLSAAFGPLGVLSRYSAGGQDWRFGYDPQNRMISAESSSGTTGPRTSTSFGYDAHGARLWKLSPDGTVTIYVSPRYTHALLPSGGTKATRYLGAGRKPVVSLASSGSQTPPTVTYFHQDYRRSIVATSGGAAGTTTLAARIAYDPLGTVVGGAGAPGLERKFGGLIQDDETSLYDHGARYLNAMLGRFLTPDSQPGADWTRQDAHNRYAYALNAATSLGDVGGRFACRTTSIGAGIGAGAVSGVAAGMLAEGNKYAPLAGVAAFIGESVGVGGGVFAICETLKAGTRRAAARAAQAAAQDATRPTTAARQALLEEPLLPRSVAASAERQGARNPGEEEMRVFRSRDQGVQTTQVPPDQDPLEWGCLCFTRGTLVATPRGPQPIESVDAGDAVWARDVETGTPTKETVRRRTVHGKRAERLLLVTVGDSVIEATPEHPFWNQRRAGWVPAEQLRPGDLLLTRSGAAVEVAAVEERIGLFAVYNFEVANAHNYYVSEAEVLVHNRSCLGENDGLGGETELGSGTAAASSEAAAADEMATVTSAADATADVAASELSAAAAAGTVTGGATGASAAAASTSGVAALAITAEAAAAADAAAAAEEALAALAVLFAL